MSEIIIRAKLINAHGGYRDITLRDGRTRDLGGLADHAFVFVHETYFVCTEPHVDVGYGTVSTTLDALEQMSGSEREALLLPVESLFATLEAVRLSAFYEKLCRNGCEIYQKKIKTDLATGTRVRLCTADGRFFALGEVRDFDDGSAIKAIKFFEI